jgi:hypothetical protein
MWILKHLKSGVARKMGCINKEVNAEKGRLYSALLLE